MLFRRSFPRAEKVPSADEKAGRGEKITDTHAFLPASQSPDVNLASDLPEYLTRRKVRASGTSQDSGRDVPRKKVSEYNVES